LNLFLVTVVTHKAHAPDLEKYVKLLTSFHSVTGKKSADINYIGYKDRKNILMHAAHRGTPRAVEVLLNYKIETEVRDPMGKTAAFYAIRNSNE
jgi:ankyrin repeat protein